MHHNIFETLKPIKYREAIISPKEKLFDRLKKELPTIQKNVLLKNHTTFKIGGPAEYFFIANNTELLLKAIKIGKKLKLPIFIFGGGSNLLVSDRGMKGLIVKLQNSDKTFNIIKLRSGIAVKANSGTGLKNLVEFSVHESLQGLEWAGGLPGTFGGAVRGNAGAFGGEIKDTVAEVEALDNRLRLRRFSNAQCRFSYRSSIFKRKNWVVTAATLRLKRGDKHKLQATVASRIQYRQERHPLEYPNAGSIFKNIPFSAFSPKLKKKLAAVVKQDPFPVVPTAYLISEARLKGTRVGNAQVSPKHPNFIVNLGDAKAADVVQLMKVVARRVREKFGVDLEPEVQLVGFEKRHGDHH